MAPAFVRPGGLGYINGKMALTVDVISIGTLSRNVFWGERAPLRTAHATTTLIRDAGRTILVDPSLPAELLAYRLGERAGLKPEQIDAVFLTSFRPTHRLALGLFDRAEWLINEDEKSAVTQHLETLAEQLRGERAADGQGEFDPAEVNAERDLIARIKPAPDRLTPSVHLFPSPGPTVGSAALLIAGLKTTIIAGDAVLTRDHFENARIFDRSVDAAAAQKSFADIVEVADAIIPGHDNLFWAS